MEKLLRGRVPFMQNVLDITRQPGLSVGVLHHGEEVFKHNIGMRDVDTGDEINSDTIYCIASLTKAFVATAIDIVLQEHHLSWDSKIHTILPDFKHVVEPAVYSQMTVRDISSHRTGLLSLDHITQGMHNRILLPKEKVIEISNGLPVVHDLRTKFLYNNAMFELAGRVIEDLSHMPTWGNFLNERIFVPLDLKRTTAFVEVHQEENVATPYAILTDGSAFRCPPPEISAESMNGGSGGVRSSLNDLLKWSRIMLAALEPDGDASVVRKHSPIFTRNMLVDGDKLRTGDYCAGWVYHQTPSKLGWISPNRSLLSPTLGEDSPSIDVYSHQGDLWGYTCNIYILPNTKSAIVVLSNGTGLSDATDWIAQDLIQTMFDLKPSIDFLKVAKQASQKYLNAFDSVKKLLLQRQVKDTKSPPLADLIGIYVMEGLDLVYLEVLLDLRDVTALKLVICGQEDQIWKLWHYNYNVFCHLPESYDYALKRGLFDSSPARDYLIEFVRDDHHQVCKLVMNMTGGIAVQFFKLAQGENLGSSTR